MEDPDHNPMQHPAEQPSGSDGEPRFGRLLLVLVTAVMLIIGLTFLSEALYS